MKRGEVWWVDMPAPAGRRPAVLLSRNAAYRVRAAITVAPITRTIRNIPVEVILDRSDGMLARCVVNQVRNSTYRVSKNLTRTLSS